MQKLKGPPTETLPSGLAPALKRPAEKAIRSFRPWMIGADTIATLLDNDWSLGICCRHCPRTIEMKPEAIQQRFGTYRALRLIDLLPNLECSTQMGCGSRDMVVFPWKERPIAPKLEVVTIPPPELTF